jgi:putative glutamine amidotransferase
MKPLIAVNADVHEAQYHGSAWVYCSLKMRYLRSIQEAGGVPVLIPPLLDDAELGQVLCGAQGVLLTGGADLDPRRDGFMLHPAMRILNPVREDFDRRLVRRIAERRLPVLAIGCGMQLLNLSQGGSLFFHLCEDLPRALPHYDWLDPALRHGLEAVPGSLLARVYGEGEIRVNSMHHMAVDEVAPGFRVTARCPDGVIEAIESSQDDWFAVGTQFHPESESASLLDFGIFEEFVAAAATRCGRKGIRPRPCGTRT